MSNQTHFVYDAEFREKYKHLGCIYPKCGCEIFSGWNGVMDVCPKNLPKISKAEAAKARTS